MIKVSSLLLQETNSIPSGWRQLYNFAYTTNLATVIDIQ